MVLSMPCGMMAPVTTTTRAIERLTEARALVASGEARRIRLAAGLSLLEVGAPVGVDPSTIGRWERRERMPRGRAAIRYAQVLRRLQAQVNASSEMAS